MNSRCAAVLGIGMLVTGCAVYEIDTTIGPSGGGGGAHVDAYVYIPNEIKELIAPRVAGYQMPPTSRYSYDLYPYDYVVDSDNRPCYIRTDFNGDLADDYAFLFSTVDWEGGYWELTTKMLVAVSTCCGYELSAEMILGTVTAPSSTPVEEYWAIALLRAGTHSVTTYYNGVAIKESVTLEDDGFFLKSLDGTDNSVLYVEGTETYEMAWENGVLAKRSAQALGKTRAARVIQLKKQPAAAR